MEVRTDHLATVIGCAATWASAAEVLVCPKPGLVDPLDRGCHDDMDWTHFLLSCSALAGFWSEQAKVGLSGIAHGEALEALRRNGLAMERVMFEATGGVNTHKGLIFALSLWVYGAGRCATKGLPMDVSTMGSVAAGPATGLVDRELRPLKDGTDRRSKLTHGERLYLEHSVTGIRGEAEAGFPTVVNRVYPAVKEWIAKGASLNDAALMGLLSAMESCEDSNVIHRGGYEFWAGTYKRAVRNAIQEFNPLSGDHSPLFTLDAKLKEAGVSPGGAADLLACGLFALMMIDKELITKANGNILTDNIK
ncbi:Triphosphoribosyl-dephospho-CoA synthetase [Thermanaerovibrio velox DSM 12556]|uniref:triphosphoribosyl-dephospho-CoA synthase n=1 Tax=Thermanaerovibrio velox DSM 12556 TaxID=926567 RepID=H0UMX4_9BACT|nr:triphosphoribosyl-dephospho-CoA synthase [Thermanaerovibrio velox]EHM10329.1 Triphosphoribosyl-dephospho-CoA synthetase [Thermanaerovibrio velox DSM 12556]